MASCRKTLSRYTLLGVVFTFIIWYGQSPDSSIPENVITINKETWNLLQKRMNLPKSVDTEFQVKNVKEPVKMQRKIQKSSEKKDPVPRPTKPKVSKKVDEKDERLFRILKDSSNVETDPSAPKDSSYSIMNNNKREPLDDNEPVILVWWAPDYFKNSKRANLLEREFQGVCGKCRLTTDRSTFHRSNAVLFDNIPMKSKLEDLPSQKLRYLFKLIMNEPLLTTVEFIQC